MKLFTLFTVMAIWVYLVINLPIKLISPNPFLYLYLIGMIFASFKFVINFLVWNFYEGLETPTN
jgi:hypothetical protein